jgi:hypothetical protein
MNLRGQRGIVAISGIICIAFALIIGFWVLARIDNIGALIRVDFDTATTVIQRLSAVFVMFALAIWKRTFLRGLAFFPLCLIFVLSPAFHYWSIGSTGERAWYGQFWIHIVIALVFFAVGYWGPKRRADIDSPPTTIQ